ncbi:zinc-binding dehydrogenase [Parenemella sanctibonifatiensis]|uniref:L-idonate 5-dehydrogenase n=1 Tax=Parenemella sanctibonifatiensis TaxID=2016505 RepID=A0A255EDL4_9ACTN|nr:zinc-binding dehydrogenase [Parenemella sanctibonifatiensis]OYN89360.1 L-idonate 5-dehydrogenase [Parenemella sanctibonifatiensis]
MQSVVIRGKQDMIVANTEVPQPGPDEVRIAIDYVGICGSDMHYYENGANGAFTITEPLVPGHELSGRIDADPSGTYAQGTPVTVHPAGFGPDVEGMENLRHLRPGGSYLGSAATTPHRQGAMSDYLIIGRDSILTLPESLPQKRAALAEPLGVALHGVNLAYNVVQANGETTGVEGKNVLVAGAGPIGLLTAFAAKVKGAAKVTVTDVLDGPLERAKLVGADEVINVREAEIPAKTFDVALECSSAPVSVQGCINGLKPRGILVQVGILPNAPIQLNLASLVNQELQILGSFRFDAEVEEAIGILDQHPEIDQILTHTFAAKDVHEAFAVAHDSQASGKVLVALQGDV